MDSVLKAYNISHEAIAEHYRHIKAAVDEYFRAVMNDDIRPDDEALLYCTKQEIEAIKDRILAEEDIRASFMLLTFIEAIFKKHCREIVETKKKGIFLKPFRSLLYDKGKGRRERRFREVSLERIIEQWKALGRFKGDHRGLDTKLAEIFRFRHWVAHGRFWDLALPQKGKTRYDFDDIYILAEQSVMLLRENS